MVVYPEGKREGPCLGAPMHYEVAGSHRAGFLPLWAVLGRNTHTVHRGLKVELEFHITDLNVLLWAGLET